MGVKSEIAKEIERRINGGLIDMSLSDFKTHLMDIGGLSKLSMSEGRSGAVTLNRIQVSDEQKGKGIGAKAMEAITDWADSNTRTVGLTPSGDFGGSVPKLKQFYKKFGFVENKGKNKDYEVSESFLRNPQALKSSSLAGMAGIYGALNNEGNFKEIMEELNSRGALEGINLMDYTGGDYNPLIRRQLRAPEITGPILDAVESAAGVELPIIGKPLGGLQSYIRGIGYPTSTMDKIKRAGTAALDFI